MELLLLLAALLLVAAAGSYFGWTISWKQTRLSPVEPHPVAGPTRHQSMQAGPEARIAIEGRMAGHLAVLTHRDLLQVTGAHQLLDHLARHSRLSKAVFERARRFVGVEDSFMPPNIALPRNQGVYFTPFLSSIMWLNQRGWAFDAQTGLQEPRRDLVGWAARRLAVQGSRMSAASRLFVRNQEPAVSLKTRSGLLEYYLPDILQLQELMQVDLSAWRALPSS